MTRTRWVLAACTVIGAAGLVLARTSVGDVAGRVANPALLNPPMPTTPRGPAYVQPINYSHKLHAGKLGIDCAYCHTNVDKSPIANIPNVSTCMNCHATVRIDRPEIVKLAKYYNDRRSVPWVHVH